MYPDRILFQDITPDIGGIWVQWDPIQGTEVQKYMVYRSSVAIPPDATERFYGGAFAQHVQVVPVDPERMALFDETPPNPAWYLVQAALTNGDIVSVSFSLRIAGTEISTVPEDAARVRDEGASHCHANVYRTMPTLVFREDDKAVRTSTHHMARSLALRFRTDGPEDDKAED
jgi:hypothetical protein